MVSEGETIALDRRVQEIKRLRRIYGKGRWRKRNGFAKVKNGDHDIAAGNRAQFHAIYYNDGRA